MFEDKYIPLDVWVSHLSTGWWTTTGIFSGHQMAGGTDPERFRCRFECAATPSSSSRCWPLRPGSFPAKGLAIFTVITMTLIGLLGLWEEP
jgi:hypothetical protein